MKLPFQRKKNGGELSTSTAEQMLANVFAACGQEPNSVPLEALSSYSNYRKERYAIQRTVIAVVLLLFLLLPVLFLAADVQVSLNNPGENANPVYTVSVSGSIPIRQIRAEIGGRNVPLYEISGNEYMVKPRDNGEMRISVTLLNRQITIAGVNVDGVDVNAPQLLYTDTDDQYVYFYVSDAECEVDYERITVTDPRGAVSGPAGYDARTGCVYFDYPDHMLMVRIPDIRGNALQIELKPEG